MKVKDNLRAVTGIEMGGLKVSMTHFVLQLASFAGVLPSLGIGISLGLLPTEEENGNHNLSDDDWETIL